MMGLKRVLFLPSPPMTTCQGWSALKPKRRTLWHHPARNHLVADVAEACLKQEKKKLKELAIPCKNGKQGVWTHRVEVLVENTEHAHALAELLPEWDVLDAVEAQEPADEEEDDEEGVPLTSGGIITWMYAARNAIDANYLIRATGWRGKIGLEPRNSWLKTSTRRLTIVDFDDQWDRRASTDTAARVEEYLEQGLEVTWNKEKQPQIC
jgi:hypothetical protein